MAFSPINKFLSFANELRFRNLFLLVSILFTINFFIPDFIPFIDEIILGLMAIILANIRKNKKIEHKGDIIEGEVVDDKNDMNNPD